ncbi:E1-E2 ATPase family protein (macronuclear) [Tetrahymena thermophila SB210]|uniref:E1-E2 ATPase family protein n=1 Tax=Tetrahymena thermophila (strain SB210) TaxID=312017 RepID=I7ME76_TETTS|nr:E1-E2 ATPase family protein [Tetrahymena thermophila SB210]EAR95651.1 E1-E2 ATPase family protein [Tetrahymena thermophila SB210]|eukprot:XP_001015896.1 E1-E2 ATPase family protein [Tetrahymena thermophila SB210]
MEDSFDRPFINMQLTHVPVMNGDNMVHISSEKGSFNAKTAPHEAFLSNQQLIKDQEHDSQNNVFSNNFMMINQQQQQRKQQLDITNRYQSQNNLIDDEKQQLCRDKDQFPPINNKKPSGKKVFPVASQSNEKTCQESNASKSDIQANQTFPFYLENQTNSQNFYYPYHAMTLKNLQQYFKFDGERGLSSNQIVQNRSQFSNQHSKTQINLEKVLNQRYEVVINLLLQFKFVIILSAIIFFFSFAYYQSDPSQILLALFLVWIAILNKRKSFDELQQEKLQSVKQKYIPSYCTVIREGQQVSIQTSSVVAGDIIVLQQNSLVPVDSRVLTIDRGLIMKADISAVFEEKLPKVLSTFCNYPSNYLKSQNVVPQGAKIVQGSGKVIALMSADESFCMKQINSLIFEGSKQVKLKNPIKSELNHFATNLSYLSIIIALVFILVSRLAFDCSNMTSFVFAGSVFIAFVPEGLLTQVYLAKFMRQKSSCNKAQNDDSQKKLDYQPQEASFKINKYEQVIENLSYINCICTNFDSLVEKPQTEVTGMWVSNTLVNSSKDIFNQIDYFVSNKSYLNLITGSVLANDSLFSTPNSSQFDSKQQKNLNQNNYLPYEAEGDLKDVALLRLCQNVFDVNTLRFQSPIVINENGNLFKIPYDERSQYSAVLVKENQNTNEEYTIYIKGNPHIIMKACTQILIYEDKTKITEEIYDKFCDAISKFQIKGEDIIAVAKLPISKQDLKSDKVNSIFDVEGQVKRQLSDFIMLGLFSFSSPTANNLERSLKLARTSGTKVVIVSEKDTVTAFSIASNCGLFQNLKMNEILIDQTYKTKEKEDLKSQLQSVSAVVMNGARLNGLNSTLELESPIFDCLNKQVCIFANTSQEQKKLLIPYMRHMGFKIGVISNEITDLMFMNSGDISFSGTQATPLLQGLSDVQLIRNKYQSDISAALEAIEEGRCYMENTKKIFALSGSTKMSQILPLLAFIILRIPLALSAMFMILLSCVTNFIPALSLAKEDPDIDILFIKQDYQQYGNMQKITSQPKQTSNKVATFGLFFYSYFFIGAIAAGAGFCAYFTTMNHLGFPIKSTFQLFDKKGYTADLHVANNMGYDIDVVNNYLQTAKPHLDIPADTVLDPSMPHWNSLFMTLSNDCEYDIQNYNPTHQFIDWADKNQSKVDLRKFYVYCDQNDKKWKNLVTWSDCDPTDYINYSTITENTACYTSEALNYAQTSYLLAIVFFQFTNLIALKSLRWSFVHTPFNLLFAVSIILQLIICVFLVEIPGIQIIFRTRPLHFWQWGIPAAPFAVFVLLYEEIRKYFARSTRWFSKIATF